MEPARAAGALPTAPLAASDLGRLAPLLQRGIRVRAPSGCSVSAFLVEGLGIDPEYVRGRITTVFLDGSVVDDLEAARLRRGSRLALSAAMPGLVGATLRKGGYYAAMREAITLSAEDDPAVPERDGQPVEIEVKLFNLLIDEIGPRLLAAGVAVPRAEAAALLGERAAGPGDGAGDVWLRVLVDPPADH